MDGAKVCNKMTNNRRSNHNFKEFPLCAQIWVVREDFLKDPSIKLTGYKVDFENLESGLFFFNHNYRLCKTTLAIETGKFIDLYDNNIYPERKTGRDECLGYCLHKYELRQCPEKCECAYIREIVQLIKNDPNIDNR